MVGSCGSSLMMLSVKKVLFLLLRSLLLMINEQLPLSSLNKESNVMFSMGFGLMVIRACFSWVLTLFVWILVMFLFMSLVYS